jgi:hypothetical protein
VGRKFSKAARRAPVIPSSGTPNQATQDVFAGFNVNLFAIPNNSHSFVIPVLTVVLYAGKHNCENRPGDSGSGSPWHNDENCIP